MVATQAKDKICKRLFRHRRLVADLLRVHVSGRWVREVDFHTLRPMPTEFVNRTGDRRFGDVLWLASLRDGRQVMVMIEIQSNVDSDMAARMAAYVGMVYESLTPAARGTNDRYPAIFPLVVYTGTAEWRAADNLRDVADAIPGLAGRTAGRRYVRLDLGRLPRDDLRNDRLSVLAQLTQWPFAVGHGSRALEGGGVATGWRCGGPKPIPCLFGLGEGASAGTKHAGSGTGHRRDLGLE